MSIRHGKTSKGNIVRSYKFVPLFAKGVNSANIWAKNLRQVRVRVCVKAGGIEWRGLFALFTKVSTIVYELFRTSR